MIKKMKTKLVPLFVKLIPVKRMFGIIVILSMGFIISMNGQTSNGMALIPSYYRYHICDYEDLLQQDPNQYQIREELYHTLLGILEELGTYRKQFIDHEKMIDLFPAVYFHVTAVEMMHMANLEYQYPVEKMQQIIAFYDAYEYNRKAWDNNRSLVEPHWKIHFDITESSWTQFLPAVQYVLESGIIAHVDYDLPRAIRYAFKHRYDQILTKGEIFLDFKKTDRIFSTAIYHANNDLKTVFWPDWLIALGDLLFGDDMLNQIKGMRNLAWNRAFGNCQANLQDQYDPQHPKYHNYDVRLRICNPAQNPNCTKELVFNTMLESSTYAAPTDDIYPLTDCKVTPVSRLGRTINRVDMQNYSVTNYTLPDHRLHPGTVKRSIVELPTGIYVITLGEGTGDWSLVNDNKYISGAVWGIMDGRLQKQVKEKLEGGNPTMPRPLLNQPVLNHLPLQEKGAKLCEDDAEAVSLFLFDTSGSMGESGKMPAAKASAVKTLETIQTNTQQTGIPARVGLMSFAGGCGAGSVRNVLDFSEDLQLVEQAVYHNIPHPGGGTPLPQAIQTAEQQLKEYLQGSGLEKGSLIILSDGKSTCGEIRPEDVFAYGQLGKKVKTVTAVGAPLTTNNSIQMYTVGFNIQPGSSAERDLQYLASTTGGKYFNAQDQQQLTRAFQKFHQVFIPKHHPGVKLENSEAADLFYEARLAILFKDYLQSQSLLQEYLQLSPEDPAGYYNLAIAFEARDHYEKAIEQYRYCLNKTQDPVEATLIQKRISLLEEDWLHFMTYQKQVLSSDLAYLEQYWQRLLTDTNSKALAAEFAGFLIEKRDFYLQIPELLNSKEEEVETLSDRITEGFDRVARHIDRPNFDRTAASLLAMPIVDLKELVSIVVP